MTKEFRLANQVLCQFIAYVIYIYILFQTPWTGGACLILLVLIVVSTCTCQSAAPRNFYRWTSKIAGPEMEPRNI